MELGRERLVSDRTLIILLQLDEQNTSNDTHFGLTHGYHYCMSPAVKSPLHHPVLRGGDADDGGRS